MEFKPGESYYLVSTGSPGAPHATEGGWCRTHNMRLVFRSVLRQPPPHIRSQLHLHFKPTAFATHKLETAAVRPNLNGYPEGHSFSPRPFSIAFSDLKSGMTGICCRVAETGVELAASPPRPALFWSEYWGAGGRPRELQRARSDRGYTEGGSALKLQSGGPAGASAGLLVLLMSVILGLV
jgi:hypothetical protein